MLEAKIRLDNNRELTLRGVVKDERKIFGRNEILLDVKEIDPVWITREKAKRLG